MANIDWIGRKNGGDGGGEVADAVGWVASLDNEETDGFIGVRLTSDGAFEAKAFGKVTNAEVAFAAAWLTSCIVERLRPTHDD